MENPLTLIGIVGMLIGAVSYLFKLLWDTKQKEHERALAELEAIKKSYAEIAAEALKSAVATTNHYRQKYEGKPPVIPVAPVVPESSSPSTKIQREVAEVQTMRAAMANLKLITGQPPKEVPVPGMEKNADGSTHSPSLIEAMHLKEEIARVPEKTAEKVVEKIKEEEQAGTFPALTPAPPQSMPPSPETPPPPTVSPVTPAPVPPPTEE